MKTLDEVIKAIEWCTEHDQSGCSACPYADDDNRCYEEDALHYLKHLQEYYEMSREHHEPNPPLTWDELKSMEGKPVLVEWAKSEESYWCFVGEWFDDDEMRIYRIGRDYADYIHKTIYTPDIVQAYRKEKP